MKKLLVLSGIITLLMFCSRHSQENASLFFPPHHGFPAVPVPDESVPNEAWIDLGRKLFFDPILSRDSSISCSSCHLPDRAFTDGRRVSQGVFGREGTRNAPTLMNVAYHPYFFVEGGNPKLETQMLGPMETHEEMDMNIREIIDRLNNHPYYPSMFERAFPGREIEPYTVTRAIASFERSLLSGFSPFDRYYYFGDEDALTSEQKRGWKIFSSMCTSCHKGPFLTHFGFENIGLHETYRDVGRMRVSRDSADIGKVKTPTLRNVALTAPYMHDGSMATLREVVMHYQVGGKQHPNKSPLIQPLNLPEEDLVALERFLEALTDTNISP